MNAATVVAALADVLVSLAGAAEVHARTTQARVDRATTLAGARAAVAALDPKLDVVNAHRAADALAEAVLAAVAYPAHLSATRGFGSDTTAAWRGAEATVRAALRAVAIPAGAFA